ncbi:MAG: ArsA-related P-loop ATPase [Paracoccus sp. (in: a-proteobacteria)]|nr:ArsA-related P-loop ATPase [Paracoccus sp. (in: a-proteobacteria)]
MFPDLPKLVFATGKGGVGKTLLACTTALGLAESGRTVLLVPTDPASHVGQVSGLDALEIDPEAAAAEYRDRIVEPMRDVLTEKALKDIEEQLSGACAVGIAALDEVTAPLTGKALGDAHDHFIFDTAATGHMLLLDAIGSYHRDVMRCLPAMA